ncbi:MAG TPA: hypothetical protein VFN74_24810, partial [Chloroflexota bacterium]|nr:hypothetical protein [Chloroflexota bacterium]
MSLSRQHPREGPPNGPLTSAALRLLEWLAPPGSSGALVGDLLEERAQLEERDGPARAELWLWRQVVGSAPWLVAMRWSRLRQTRSTDKTHEEDSMAMAAPTAWRTPGSLGRRTVVGGAVASAFAAASAVALVRSGRLDDIGADLRPVPSPI